MCPLETDSTHLNGFGGVFVLDVPEHEKSVGGA